MGAEEDPQDRAVKDPGEMLEDANALFRAGDYREAASLYAKRAEIMGTVYGRQHPSYVLALRDEGVAWLRLNDFERAEPLWQKTLALQRKILGNKHKDTIEALEILASLQSKKRDYRSATRLQWEVVSLRKKTDGLTRPYLLSLHRLAEIYDAMQNRTKAIRILAKLERILSKRTEADPALHIQVSEDLANCLLWKGLYKEAEVFYHKGLRLYEQIHGRSGPAYAHLCEKLASTYWRQGELSKAMEWGGSALQTFRGDQDQPCTAYLETLQNLARLYEEAGEHSKSHAALQDAAALQKRLLGVGHPGHLGSLLDIAQSYLFARNRRRGLRLCARVESDCRLRMTENHPEYAGILRRLAGLYGLASVYVKEESLCEEVLQIRERSVSAANPEYAETVHALASAKASMHRWQEAKMLGEKSLSLCRETRGEKGEKYCLWLAGHAKCLSRLRNREDAGKVIDEAMKRVRRLRKTDGAAQLQVLEAKAYVLERNGEYAQSSRYRKQALKMAKRLYGENYPDYALWVVLLAEIPMSERKWLEAERAFLQILDSLGRFTKADAFLLPACYGDLAKIYVELGALDNAETYCKRGLADCKEFLDGSPSVDILLRRHLAKVHHLRHQCDEAEGQYQEVLSLYREMYGERHFLYGNALYLIGAIRESKSDFPSAKEMYEKAFGIYSEFLAAEPSVLSESHFNECVAQLTALYERQGEKEQADAVRRKAAELKMA